MEDSERLTEIEARLNDSKTLEDLVYNVFYSGPIAFARQNLVKKFQRHVLGLPLTTPEEEREEMLSKLTPEERAQWWREHNTRAPMSRGAMT